MISPSSSHTDKEQKEKADAYENMQTGMSFEEIKNFYLITESLVEYYQVGDKLGVFDYQDRRYPNHVADPDSDESDSDESDSDGDSSEFKV